MKSKIACFILSYEITKGMKSFGPIGLLKSSSSSKELILHQIDSMNKIFYHPDIFIVSGFGADKLDKKISGKIKTLINKEYETKNHGYVLKLILSSIDTNKYDGVFILNSGTLIKESIPKSSLALNNSWLLLQKNKKNYNRSKYIGSMLDSQGIIDYMFYDIGDYRWCDTLYLCKQDVETLKPVISSFYDNMFLFECINRSITKYKIKYSQVVISSESLTIITGTKDKHKIKE
jgi:hypothetical protein